MADTVFGRLFGRSAAPGLIRQFGEPITYFKRDGAEGRRIQAIVERDVPDVIAGTDIVGQSMIVKVKNSSLDGIASDEVNTGGDEISVPLRVGQNPEIRRIAQVMADNGGMVRLVCN